MQPLFRTLSLLTIAIPAADPWLVPQPKESVWVPLAKTLRQDSLCMDTNTAKVPMSTWLVRIPWGPGEYKTIGKGPDPAHNWDKWMKAHAQNEPQHLDLLGSSQAHCCSQFGYKLKSSEPWGHPYNWLESPVQMKTPFLDATPINKKNPIRPVGAIAPQ